MAKVKTKTRGIVRFSKDIPYQMAMACKSLQPFFTSSQIAGLTGIKKEHVQKTICVWKEAKLVKVIGEGRHDNIKAPFYLYTITPDFEKKLSEADIRRPSAKVITVAPVAHSIPSGAVMSLRQISLGVEELRKIIG